MFFFDIIRELRTGEPSTEKAAKTLMTVGWICLGVGIWNFVLPFIAPFEESPFNIPEMYPYFALISMTLVGFFFFLSSRNIKNSIRMGIKIGQTAILLLILTIIGFVIIMFEMTGFLPDILPFKIFFSIMMCAVFGQFLIPSYLGILYLQRLPIKEKSLEEMRFGQEYQSTQHNTEITQEKNDLNSKYKEALLPFGVGGSFFLLMASLMIPLFAIQKFYGMEMMPLIFIPGFILIFFGPMVYNSLPSSFEKSRKVISSFTGGGSIFMFNGSWPFFRLFVYADGIEIRVMLHRFFIPHDKMGDISENVGFFSKGILIKSDLTGVPSSIRFIATGSKKAVQNILDARNAFFMNKTEDDKDPTLKEGN
jgi:hypothetical protein